MHTHVVTLGGKHWPAWQREDGLLVDVRLFGPSGQLVFWERKLREAGLPENLIRQAGESVPAGFLLFC